MANEKVIQTRLSLKIDTYANWTNLSQTGKGGNLVLNKGEIGLCEIPAGNGAATTAPTVLFKVGDGTLPFHHADPTKCLKWASGLAADVYAWAKRPNPDWNDFPALPIEVVDNGTGKFVTDITYADNKITITREDAVNTLAGGNGTDNIITTKVDKSKGDVTVTADHAKKGPTNGYTGGQTAGTVDTFGESVTIKVPKLTIDAYGHVNSASDVDYKVAIPVAPDVNDGTLTLNAGSGLAGEQKTFSANDADNVEFTVSHGAKPTTGNAHTTTQGTGRTYVTKVDVDAYGHIAKVYTASETDQDLSGYQPKGDYKTKQTAVADQNLSGATVIKGVAQNENGEITVSTRTLTAADLGLDTVMHFVGAYSSAPTKAFQGTNNERELANGDVYLNTANNTEYIYSAGKWTELGNEAAAGSHALKTIKIIAGDGLTGGGDLSTDRTLSVDYTTLNAKYQEKGTYLEGTIDGGLFEVEEWDDLNFNIAGSDTITVNKKNLALEEDIPTKPEDIGAAPAPDEDNLYLELVNNGETGTITVESSSFETINFDGVVLQYDGKEVAVKDDIPTEPEDIGAKKVQSAVTDKITDKAHVLDSLTQNANGDISYTVKKLTPDDIGAASAPVGTNEDGEKNVFLELENNGDLGTVTIESSGFETIDFDDVALTVNGNEVLTTASTISTDKLVGGSEIWIIDCGTATTVI